MLAIIGTGTLFSWAAWLLVFLKLDPYESTELALSLFFISTHLALAGSFTLFLFFIKQWKAEKNVYIKHIMISLRQGILLSICTCLCLALLMLGLLRIWNGVLIVSLMMMVEFYLSGRDEI